MNILCRMPDRECSSENLEEISGLIYDTDPYIYPAMFSSREEAVTIISKMICSSDSMFNLENMYVAYSDRSIIGLVLWHRGSFSWEAGLYVSCGGHSQYIHEVRERYFSNYADIPSDTVSLINVCTSVRNKGVGNILLESFLNTVSGPYELYVLADNKPAIRLYEKHGFHVVESSNGFSIDRQDLLCYKMQRD